MRRDPQLLHRPRPGPEQLGDFFEDSVKVHPSASILVFLHVKLNSELLENPKGNFIQSINALFSRPMS